MGHMTDHAGPRGYECNPVFQIVTHRICNLDPSALLDLDPSALLDPDPSALLDPGPSALLDPGPSALLDPDPSAQQNMFKMLRILG